MICINCAYHSSFKEFISHNGAPSRCSYCNTEEVSIEDNKLESFLLDKAESILVSANELSGYEQALIFEGGCDEPAVFPLSEFFESNLNSVHSVFASNFVNKLLDQEDKDASPVLYALNDGTLDEINHFGSDWNSFHQSIKHNKRFFNDWAFDFCKRLFDSVIEDRKLTSSLIATVQVTQPLYRARIASSSSQIKEIEACPFKQLGRVPANLSSSQRMTPSGVSAFYATFERNTCISELRPIVGDAVVTGEFRANKELSLLDLNALKYLECADDLFSNEWLVRSHAYAFFPELVFMLTRPSGRGRQNEYLETQVIFEYLRTRFSSDIQGLIYPSTQKNGANECIVLFPEYSESNEGYVDLDNRGSTFRYDKASLFFVPESIKFHQVKSATFEATEEDTSLFVTSPDSVLKKLFPEHRF